MAEKFVSGNIALSWLITSVHLSCFVAVHKDWFCQCYANQLLVGFYIYNIYLLTHFRPFSGSYTCSCLDGYVLKPDGRKCKAIGEFVSSVRFVYGNKRQGLAHTGLNTQVRTPPASFSCPFGFA